MPPLTQDQTTAIDNANKNATVNADALLTPPATPKLPTNTPPVAPTVTPFDINQYITQPAPVDNTQLEQQTSSVFDQLLGAQNQAATRGNTVTTLENNAGVPQLTLDLADIQNQITQKELDFRRQREAIAKNAGISTAAQRDAELADVSRKQSSELADLEVIRAARSSSLNAIQSIIDRKVQREFADEDKRIENLKFIYEQKKGDLTKAQDRQYQQMITRETRAFELAKGKYEQVENAKASMVKNAAMSGADSSTMAKIMASKDINELYSTPGYSKYITSPLEKLDMELKQVSLSKNRYDLKKLMGESGIGGNLSADQKEKILGNKNAQQASARIGIIKALELYKSDVEKYLNGEYKTTDEKTAARKALNAALNTTVGSAINVAQGQGAMGDTEAKRILSDLMVGVLTQSKKNVPSAIDGVIASQDALFKNDMSFVDSAIPGASSGFQLFADYTRSKADPLLVNDSKNPENNRLNLNI